MAGSVCEFRGESLYLFCDCHCGERRANVYTCRRLLASRNNSKWCLAEIKILLRRLFNLLERINVGSIVVFDQ